MPTPGPPGMAVRFPVFQGIIARVPSLFPNFSTLVSANENPWDSERRGGSKSRAHFSPGGAGVESTAPNFVQPLRKRVAEMKHGFEFPFTASSPAPQMPRPKTRLSAKSVAEPNPCCHLDGQRCDCEPPLGQRGITGKISHVWIESQPLSTFYLHSSAQRGPNEATQSGLTLRSLDW